MERTVNETLQEVVSDSIVSVKESGIEEMLTADKDLIKISNFNQP